MSNVLTWVKSRLEHRGDSEHGQALIRVALISIILVYALLPSSRAALPADDPEPDVCGPTCAARSASH